MVHSLRLPVCTLGLALLVITPALAAPNKEERKQARQAKKEAWLAEQARVARLKRCRDLVAMLQRPDPLDRLHSTWNLQALQPESREVLIELLATRKANPDALVSAAQILGELGNAQALPALKGLYREGTQTKVRLAALIAIAKLQTPQSQGFLREEAKGEVDSLLTRVALLASGMTGDHTVRPAVEAALKGQDAETRRAAYRTLGYLKDRRFIPTCVEGLNDPHPLVRAQAGNALGKIGDPRTVDAILGAIKPLRPGAARFLLVESLAWLGKQAAVEELLRSVVNRRSPVQSSSATCLFEINEPRALPPFRKVLDESLRGKHLPGADTLIAYALGEMKDGKSVDVLIKALLKGRVDVRREAAHSLGILGDERAVKPLQRMIKGGDRRLRSISLIALARLGAPKAWTGVRAATKDRDATVRWASTVAFEALGEARGVPLLKPLLQDPHEFVRVAAERAIASLSGEELEQAPDPRSGLHMTRLRALEREYLLRAQTTNLFETLTQLASPPPSKPSGPWEGGSWEVVGYESYMTTCGGTHPPIEIQVPLFEFVEDPSQERPAPSAAAPSQAPVSYNDQFEETYRLMKLRSEARAVLDERRAERRAERKAATEGGARQTRKGRKARGE